MTSSHGQQKIYSVVISRGTTTDLADLQTSAGDLSPVFDPRQTTYTVSAAPSMATATITATAADRTATIQINGQPAVTGQPFGPVPLAEGPNTFTISVSVPSVSGKVYTVTVIRQPLASNADLSNLTVSSGTLMPAFNPAVTTYVVNVETTVESLTVTATAQQGSSNVSINNESLGSGGTSSPIPLVIGANSVTVAVKAPSGATVIYAITVNRAPESSGRVSLQGLTVSPGTLSPPFNSNTLDYNVAVENNVTTVNVTALKQELSTLMTVNGQVVASGQTIQVPVAVGPNAITVVLTAPAGDTRQYTVTVTRAAPVSNNVSLRTLQIVPGTLSPVFAPSITSYSVNLQPQVASLHVIPTAQTGSAVVTVNGQQVQSGGSLSVSLIVGTNTIVVRVSSPSGNAQDYTIVAIRAGPSNNANQESVRHCCS